MRYKSLVFIGLAALTAGCSKSDFGIIPDAKSYLSTMDGPSVDGVKSQLTKQAKEAENVGDFRAATTYYQQLLEKDPQNKELTIAYADALRRAGDIDRSIATYDNLLAREPANGLAKEGKALALLQRGDMQNAETLLLEARAAGVTSWRSANALGIASAGKLDYPKARQYFDEALRGSPNNPSVMNNLGLAMALNQEFDPAIATMAQASTLASSKPAVRKQIDLNSALVYASAGKLDNAEAIARMYFTDAALNNNLGFYAHLSKDNQLARTYLNMALTQSKTFYQRAWNNMQALNTADTLPPATLPPAPQPLSANIMPAIPSDSPSMTPQEPPAPVETKSAKKGKSKQKEKDEATATPLSAPRSEASTSGFLQYRSSAAQPATQPVPLTPVAQQPVQLPPPPPPSYGAPPPPSPAYMGSATPPPPPIGAPMPPPSVGAPMPPPSADLTPPPPPAGVAPPPMSPPIMPYQAPAAGQAGVMQPPPPPAGAPMPLPPSGPQVISTIQPGQIGAKPAAKKSSPENGFEAVGDWMGSLVDW